MEMKLFKIIIFSGLFGALIGYGSIKYLHSKMEKELITYLILNAKVNELKDIHALCNGLIKTNPTNKNLKACQAVTKKIESISSNIKDKCPYISFYINYFGEIK